MGQQHLIRALAVGVGLAVTACGRGQDAAPRVAVAHPRHVQFVYALKGPERLALVEQLRRRNGPEWTVNEEALLQSATVVDPFVGIIRRARRTKPPGPADASVDAAASARAFVRKNADLLGVPRSMLLALLETTEATSTGWTVKLEGLFPSKGYETFPELGNEIELTVHVEQDGSVSRFENRSKLHPARLGIDTRPGLPQDDWRIYRNVAGRRVFAMTDDGERMDLGVLAHDELLDAKLVMQVTPGPMNAWLTYRLTWLIRAAKEVPDQDGAGFYFFFFLVDTDTAEVVQDSPVPTRFSGDTL